MPYGDTMNYLICVPCDIMNPSAIDIYRKGYDKLQLLL